MTPAEVKQEAINEGIKPYAGYPYTVIYKLKERGKIEPNQNGRYVAT